MTNARVSYSVGSEHNPLDPVGRSVLEIDPDGGARLGHFKRFEPHRAWIGRVDPDTLARLRAALERAGFPRCPAPLFPPDATIRNLVVEAAGNRQALYLGWHASDTLPGYDEAFRIVDATARHLSENTVQISPAGQPATVSDIQRLF